GAELAGATYSSRCRIRTFAANSSSPAQTNPMSGDSSSDFPTPTACAQSTPLVPLLAAIIWFARPTPMIDPISVCELEDGSPKYHVPRFQIIAAVSSANTIAKPAPVPTCRISSAGRSDTMPNATIPDDTSTPAKFQRPDQTTATGALSECV